LSLEGLHLSFFPISSYKVWNLAESKILKPCHSFYEAHNFSFEKFALSLHSLNCLMFHKIPIYIEIFCKLLVSICIVTLTNVSKWLSSFYKPIRYHLWSMIFLYWSLARLIFILLVIKFSFTVQIKSFGNGVW